MKRHGNLFERLVSEDNIRLALHNATRGKLHRHDVKHLLARDEDAVVAEIKGMLTDGSYRTANYHTKRIYEPKERDIYILPLYPDRIVQHALVNVLEPIWDNLLIYDTYCCRKGKGTHKGAARVARFVRQFKWYVQMDIRKFYPSMRHDVLKRVLAEKIKDARVLNLLYNIVDSFPGEKNVPIGNLTSQWFGNLYMAKLDRLVKNHIRAKGYVRYCDDFVLFGDSAREVEEKYEVIKTFCACELGLEVKPPKIGRTKDGVDILGYRIFPGYILMRKRTVARLRKRINGLRRVMARGVTSVRKLESIMSSLASARGYARRANAHNFCVKTDIEEFYDNVHRQRDELRGLQDSRSNARRKDADSQRGQSANHRLTGGGAKDEVPGRDGGELRQAPVHLRGRPGE